MSRQAFRIAFGSACWPNCDPFCARGSISTFWPVVIEYQSCGQDYHLLVDGYTDQHSRHVPLLVQRMVGFVHTVATVLRRKQAVDIVATGLLSGHKGWHPLVHICFSTIISKVDRVEAGIYCRETRRTRRATVSRGFEAGWRTNPYCDMIVSIKFLPEELWVRDLGLLLLLRWQKVKKCPKWSRRLKQCQVKAKHAEEEVETMHIHSFFCKVDNPLTVFDDLRLN